MHMETYSPEISTCWQSFPSIMNEIGHVVGPSWCIANQQTDPPPTCAAKSWLQGDAAVKVTGLSVAPTKTMHAGWMSQAMGTFVRAARACSQCWLGGWGCEPSRTRALCMLVAMLFPVGWGSMCSFAIFTQCCFEPLIIVWTFPAKPAIV